MPKLWEVDDPADSGRIHHRLRVSAAQPAGVPPLAELDPDEFRAFLDSVSPDEFAADPEDS